MSEWPEGLEQQKADYKAGLWCGECRYHVVEEPPCCWPPSAPARSNVPDVTKETRERDIAEVVRVRDMRSFLIDAMSHLETPADGPLGWAGAEALLDEYAEAEVVAAVTAERERADAELAELRERIEALAGQPSPAKFDGNGNYAGREAQQSEHRTTGGRAWCHGCGEWCYEDYACPCCEPKVEPADLRALGFAWLTVRVLLCRGQR